MALKELKDSDQRGSTVVLIAIKEQVIYTQKLHLKNRSMQCFYMHLSRPIVAMSMPSMLIMRIIQYLYNRYVTYMILALAETSIFFCHLLMCCHSTFRGCELLVYPPTYLMKSCITPTLFQPEPGSRTPKEAIFPQQNNPAFLRT